MTIEERAELKPIADFPDYFASRDGDIYSMKPLRPNHKKPDEPRKLKPGKKVDGRLMVSLMQDGKAKTKQVHALILETFAGPRPKGMLACHGIKGKLCNSIDNLYWATPSQNCGADLFRDGGMVKHSSLNELQVRIIRRSYVWRGRGWGISCIELSRIFGVSEFCIYGIVHRKHWRFVP